MTTTALTINCPEPPSYFNGDAAWKWRETWPRLDHNRVDAAGKHRDILIDYCEAYSDKRKYERKIADYGKEYDSRDVPAMLKPQGEAAAELMPSKTGLTRNDYVNMRNEAITRMNEAGMKLGLHPDAPHTFALTQLLATLPDTKEHVEPIEQDDGTAYLPKPGEPGNPGKRKFWTVERVWSAVKANPRSPAAAARALEDAYGVKCSRETISRLVNSSPELQKLRVEAKATILEGCYDATVSRAAAGSMADQHFLLRSLDPEFRNKTEVSGPGGGPITVQAKEIEDERPGDHVFDGIAEDQLTEAERAELATIADNVDAVGGVQFLPVPVFVRFKELQTKGTTKPAAIEGDADAA